MSSHRDDDKKKVNDIFVRIVLRIEEGQVRRRGYAANAAVKWT